MKYAMLICGDPDEWESLPPDVVSVFLEATDLDDAVAIAATWPGLFYSPRTSVEVRPVVQHESANQN